MKLSNDLSDSQYGLHNFSVYSLFSERLIDSQGKLMKTMQYICEGKNSISGLHNIRMVVEWIYSHEK